MIGDHMLQKEILTSTEVMATTSLSEDKEAMTSMEAKVTMSFMGLNQKEKGCLYQIKAKQITKLMAEKVMI